MFTKIKLCIKKIPFTSSSLLARNNDNLSFRKTPLHTIASRMFKKKPIVTSSEKPKSATSFIPSSFSVVASLKLKLKDPKSKPTAAAKPSDDTVYIEKQSTAETTYEPLQNPVGNTSFLGITAKQPWYLKLQRKWIRPHTPLYEVGFDDGTWLPLQQRTSRNIERIRDLGFSKFDIRCDQHLMDQLASVSSTSDMDVQLELWFQRANLHLPQGFQIRRAHWWRTHMVGIGYLPVIGTSQTSETRTVSSWTGTTLEHALGNKKRIPYITTASLLLPTSCKPLQYRPYFDYRNSCIVI
ncbi:uncharacterized protein BYT42DRAFT_609662 [Radiomyces spectabilis]|uniref:uncharacterized protein n=1 Tax=Radiomyces spectabilis TaxID=64574 RepID=UPI0022210B16|nr:uncharacterized protein BYT42DRAFT_609662 [Radiomyces spectabilis]KAI8393898.1 hypothetical protein BYT42DRAFT_609662 [Radiomyces spectabilis]